MAQLKVKQISDFVSTVTGVHNGAVGTDTVTAISAAKSQAISQAVVNGDIAYDVKNAASTALVSAESKDVVRAATASTATATVASNLSTELVARADGDTAAIAAAATAGDIAYDVKNAASTALVSAESKDVVRAATASTATATVASNLSTELVARADADTALDGKITTEKGRIDAILSASEADKDSFAEIVTLINSVDTTNDTAFGGYVTSNNAALSTELVARASGDTAAIASALSSSIVKADAAQAAAIAAAATAGNIAYDVKNAASTALVSAESKDVVRAATAATALSTAIATEVSNRNTAIGVLDDDLQAQINSLAGVNNVEEIAVFASATEFNTVATFDLNGHVAVFVNGLQVHEAVGAGDGWVSGDGQTFVVQGLGYDLEAGDHIIVSGKTA